MVNDPIADILARIKNAYLAQHDRVEFSHSKLKKALIVLLVRLGYVGEQKLSTDGQKLVVKLVYHRKKPALSGVERISKPGLRRYTNVIEIRRLRLGLGNLILSTPKGLMTHKEAIKQQVGGEILCRVW